ncbi:MAG: YbbR-like domain-containing protein [Acetivibrio ethanolgignens]
MKERLTNNFGIKLLSLFLAAIMWIVIINLDDPIIARTYQNITVDITNESAIASLGQVYDVVEGRTVSVTVKGKRSIVDKIKAADLKASVDLSNISSFNKVEITASCEKYAYENLEITAKPKLMQITLEDRGEKQVNVKVTTTGTPADGYSVGMIEAKPVMLAISGAESVVAKIEEARVMVDVSGETETFTRKGLEPKLYDADGNEIDASRLTFNKKTVSAKVNILKTKSVPVQVTTVGTPAHGYGIYQVDYEPKMVEIAGSDEELANISSIPLEINVDGVSADVEQTIALEEQLAKGIRIVDNVESVVVKITIKAMETREFYLNPADISTKNMPAGMNFAFASPDTSVRLRIMGMEESLSRFSVANLGAYIDLEGIGEGTHQVEIQLNLGEELHSVETPKISVKLTLEGQDEPTDNQDTEDEGGESE